MNVIKVWNEHDPKDVGVPWVAAQGSTKARGRHREEAVRNLMNVLENKREKWTEEAE